MKSFFKTLLASIFGSIIGGAIILALFVGIGLIVIAGLASLGSSETYVTKPNSILYLNLSGELLDRSVPEPLLEYLDVDKVKKNSLIDILDAIDKAKEDENIKGIYVKTDMPLGPTASFKEIRDALIQFKKTDKFIISYSDLYSQNGYYVASVADSIYMNPQGMLDLHGYAANPMFYKKMLDKLGVEMQIFKVGTYKSAVEPFILTNMSDANREQMTSLLNNMWSTYKSDVAKYLEIEPLVIDAAANSGIMFLPADTTLSLKFVDKLKFESDIKIALSQFVGSKSIEDLNLVSVSNMNNTMSFEKVKEAGIAIVYAEGDIVSGSSKKGISDGRYVEILNKLKSDDKIKAVVLRVNSPGGSAFASEQIWNAVTELKAKKPIVVSMGGYAASGGYYISCNASKVFAQPNTITGSIGIFGMFPNLEGLSQKVGIDVDVVKTNTYADLGNIARPMREDEKRLIQSNVERGYQLFMKRCAEGRGKTIDEINNIGQGRVWTGEQALSLGLVDKLGGLKEAIDEAALLASVTDYSIKSYPKQESLLDSFLDMSKQNMVESTMKDYLGNNYNDLQMIMNLKNQDGIQARLPYMTIE